MSGGRTASALAATLAVDHEALPVARALEDAAVAARAPSLTNRLRGIDRAHDRAMAALRARYQERENRYDEDWPETFRDIWGLDALALVLVAVALSLLPASVLHPHQLDAPASVIALASAGVLVLATLLHVVNAVRSHRSSSVSNERASSVIGFDAAASLAGAAIIMLRTLVPRDPLPLAPMLPAAAIATACAVVLLVVWRDARRRGEPERDRVRRYRAAEASWREDLDVEAATLAARSRAEASAAFLEVDPETRTAIEADLAAAARALGRRPDAPGAVVEALRRAPFGHLRYGDRV